MIVNSKKYFQLTGLPSQTSGWICLSKRAEISPCLFSSKPTRDLMVDQFIENLWVSSLKIRTVRGDIWLALKWNILVIMYRSTGV
jgi:hypothetical protein